MADQLVPLGFEIGTGRPISIPIAHMVVTGQSQRAGKTTAMEGLIHRAGVRSLAFRTKRGEGAFVGARVHGPYFRERADWRFVESILGAVMRQGMKFERAWIIKAARGAKSLADVRTNISKLQKKSTRAMDADLFMLLGEYLDIVVPLIAKLPNVSRIALGPGLNVMDLIAYPAELQMLVLHSALEWVHDREHGVICLLPETWKFVPQKRESPVKMAAIALAREGAGLRNFLWADSQDLAAMEKEIVRQARVYLLGVQRERNEIKRTLDHIPGGIRKPKADDLAQLGLGQFFAAWDDQLVKVYVQPAWADDLDAREAARQGNVIVSSPARFERERAELAPEVVAAVVEGARALGGHVHVSMPAVEACDPVEDETEEEPEMPKTTDEKLDILIDLMTRQSGQIVRETAVAPAAQARPAGWRDGDPQLVGEDFYQAIKARLIAEAPQLLRVLVEKPEIEIVVERPMLEIDGKSLQGRIARLLHRDFFGGGGKRNGEVVKELNRTGMQVHPSRVGEQLHELVARGFLERTDGDRFVAVEGMKVNVVEAGARG